MKEPKPDRGAIRLQLCSMWSLKWRGKQEHVVGFNFFFSFEAEFPEWGPLIARHSVTGGSSEGQLKSCFLQDRSACAESGSSSCRAGVWKQPHQPNACLGKAEKAGELTCQPASQGFGSESSSRPLPAPTSISECVGSPGLSGLCLPYYGVLFGLTGDKGCVTSEAF